MYGLGYLITTVALLLLYLLPLVILALWAWCLYGKAQQRHHAAQRQAIANAIEARRLLP